MWRAVLGKVVDAVYPPTCAGCGRRGVWVCDRCLARFGPIGAPMCAGCGLPASLPCMCRQLPLEIDAFRAAFVYDDWVKRAVHRFKYEDEVARGASMAAAMVPCLAEMMPLDALIPVSLHAKRKRERGYDQSLVLATALGRLLSVPVSECVERARYTTPQVGQGFQDRQENVRGAFSLKHDHRLAAGCRVVLVDDVRTTGATLGECALALLPLRPSYVGAVSYAAAVPGMSDGGRPHR